MQKKISFKNSKSQRLVGVLHIPKGKGPFPVVILCHGLSVGKRSSTNRKFVREPIIKKKFVVLNFDMYGHGESVGKLEDVSPLDPIKDIKAAIKFIKEQKFVDKKRIGLFGSSYSGIGIVKNIALDKSIKVLALRSPAIDYEEVRLNQIGPHGIEAWKKLGIMYVCHRPDRKGYILKYKFFKDSQKEKGYKYAPLIKAKTLIVAGDKDDYVPVHQSIDFYEKLKVKDKKLVIIKGCDHHYVNPKHKERMFKLVVNWFKKYL